MLPGMLRHTLTLGTAKVKSACHVTIGKELKQCHRWENSPLPTPHHRGGHPPASVTSTTFTLTV